MKTIQDIDNQIAAIYEIDWKLTPKDKLKAQRTKAGKRVGYLTIAKRYLETNPTEEFIRKEKERLETRLALIEQGYPKWKEWNVKAVDEKTLLKQYNDTMQTAHTKEQLEIILLILN